jgi:hypothetical protein
MGEKIGNSIGQILTIMCSKSNTTKVLQMPFKTSEKKGSLPL